MNYIAQIISLPSAEARRRQVDKVMNKAQISYSFIDAINGKELHAKDYYPICTNPNFFFNRRHVISPSEVGCRLSHKNAISDFLKNTDCEWLFVFEDDIQFKELKMANLLANLSSLSGVDPMLVHLGGQEGISCAKRVLRYDRRIVGGLEVSKVFLPTVRWLYRTCGYLVNRQAAELLTKVHDKCTFVADDWGFVLKKSGIKHLHYCDVVSHPMELLDSSIESERQK